MPYKDLEKQQNQNKKYYKTHKKSIKKRINAYFRTAKGKETIAKHNAKRKRNLQWIKMFDNPFDESVIIEWHHITDAYVVAIPKELHHQYMGKFHREKTMEIVKQIYLR